MNNLKKILFIIKKLSLTIVGMICFFGLAEIASAVCSYSGTGNWNITSSDNCINTSEIIALNGNLTIYGNLTFNNITLQVNSTYNGQYIIEVMSGGSFYLNFSNITNGPYNTSANFLFWVDSGSRFTMNNSKLHHVGYAGNGSLPAEFHDSGFKGPAEVAGLYVLANNTVIENSKISDNYIGVIFANSSYATVINSNISFNAAHGLYFYQSYHNVFRNNIISNNSGSGMWGYPGSNFTIENNTIVYNNQLNSVYYRFNAAIAFDSITNLTVKNNTLIDASSGYWGAIFNFADYSNISNNYINDNISYAMAWGGGKNSSIENNTMTGQLNVELGYNLTITNNSIYGTTTLQTAAGYAQSNNIMVSNNIIIPSSYWGISGGGFYDVQILNNVITVTPSGAWGIDIRSGKNILVENNSINVNSSGGGVEGIYLQFINNATIKNNTIKVSGSLASSGINLYSSNNNTLLNNFINVSKAYYLAVYGIHMYNSSDNVITGRAIISTDYVYYSEKNSTSNTITDIIFYNASKARFVDINDSLVIKNTNNKIINNNGNLKTIAYIDNATLQIAPKANNYEIVLETINFTLFPSSDSVNITVITWNTTGNYYKKWNESSGLVTTNHTIGNFPANKTILIKKNGLEWRNLTANSSGYINFTYDESFPATFEAEFPFPSINQIQCEINTTNNWMPCSNLFYNSTLLEVRVNCTSYLPITNVTFMLRNVIDSNVFFNASNATAVSGNWWIYNNSDLTIQDSGQWNLSSSCISREETQNTTSVSWNVSWGYLEPSLINMTNKTLVNGQSFTFQAGVSCRSGECGNINATLNPSSPVLKWSSSDLGRIASSMAIADISGEYLVFVATWCEYGVDTGHIYALYASNGSIKWDYNTSDWSCLAIPAVGDIDNDGISEVVVYDYNGNVYALTASNGTKKWKIYNDSIFGRDSSPTIIDIDKDGDIEILMPDSFGGQVIAFNGENGSILWIAGGNGTEPGTMSYQEGWIDTTLSVADIDRDNVLEVVAVTGGGIWVFSGNNGAQEWYDYNYTRHHYSYGSPVIADIDGDGQLEIIIASRAGYVNVFNGNGVLELTKQLGTDYFYSMIGLGNLDSDSLMEMVFGGNRIYALNHDGTQLWNYSAPGGSLTTGYSIADVNGDGNQEILYVSSNNTFEILNGMNGKVLSSTAISRDCIQGNSYQTPLVANIDGDGRLEAIVRDFCGIVSAYDLPGAGTIYWPTHQGNNQRTGYVTSPIVLPTTKPMSTIIGATPFYTTSNNPQTCSNMKVGDTCNQTWEIITTGSADRWQFFVAYEPVSYSTYVNSSTTGNIYITVNLTDGSSCSSASECLGEYCVRGICRSGSTYCGDGYCEGSETCSSCSTDCGCSSGYYCSGNACVMYGGGLAPVSIIEIKKTISLASPTVPAIVTIESDKAKDLKVDKVIVQVKEAVSNVQVTVKESSLPTGAAVAIAIDKGATYKFIEITTNVETDKLEKVKINFKVEKSWITANNIDEEKVVLQRYAGYKWNELTTIKVNSDATYVYYEAETTALSVFAITGEKVVVTEEKKCPTCPSPSAWNDCVNNKQTRTNYRCSAETNYQCQDYEEEKGCISEKKLFPWLITGVIVILAGAGYWKRRRITNLLIEIRKRNLLREINRIENKIPELRSKGIDVTKIREELKLAKDELKVDLEIFAKMHINNIKKMLKTLAK